MSVFQIVLLIFAVSQFYWFWRAYKFAGSRIRSQGWRLGICGALLAIYLLVFQLTAGGWRERGTPTHLTLRDAFVHAPFFWWLGSSVVGFVVALAFAIPGGVVGSVRRLLENRRKKAYDLPSPARREFLGRTATVAAAAPFVAGAYGLFYGRLNLDVAPQTIVLPRLPRAFEGFRICQFSDIHIGPFMPADQIRKFVAIANAQKADMVVLTGDFVTFDPTTQYAVVDALRELQAPFGKYGCLGNHDSWAGVSDSISDLLRQTGVHMLRGTNQAIETHGESFNLIGVDFQSPRRFGPSAAVANVLGNIAHLIDRSRVNILLSHNPDTFDRADELGIELSIAGHTHGGQAALEFISPEIAPSRLVTPYVAGLFQKPGGQLYVNRGIGTIFIPIRIGAPPEITIYKLSRG